MTKKVYLYDSYGYDFYACEYEGLDADGKPRLTIMTPGRPIENFRDRLELLEECEFDYYLLCEEGQQANPAIVVEMLGEMIINSGVASKRMPARLEEMRRFGIDYGRELQCLFINISELDKETPLGGKYRLEMSVGDQGRYIGECDNFECLYDILIKLDGFFYFVENKVGIPLKKKIRAKEGLMKQIKRKTPHLFDEYEEDKIVLIMAKNKKKKG